MAKVKLCRFCQGNNNKTNASNLPWLVASSWHWEEYTRKAIGYLEVEKV